ncbi:hypothetical protein AUP07_0343 [methanogenic archaeon mixed culture ISO4-G1]|nr:hypothetical protein AUP07_0343 [methanogenic archaeon mixed culture ISO4-G1]
MLPHLPIILNGEPISVTMDWIYGLALLVGFAPVFVAMDTVLKNYTYPRVENPFFKDSTFFGLLAVGIVEGVVLFLVIRMFGLQSSQLSVIYMAVMGIIELMAMVVVMNLRRFRGKSDSIFYGFGLGLGMAAGLASGYAYVICGLAMEVESPDYAVIIPYVVLLSVAMTFIFGACGTNIGEGIARHIPMQFVLQAAIPMVAFNMLMAALDMVDSVFMVFVILIVMVILGAFYFYKCLFRNLPAIVREVLKMNGQKRDDIPKAR